MNEKFTNARWINTGFVHINSRSDRMPAPLFRRESDGPTALAAALAVILFQNPFGEDWISYF